MFKKESYSCHFVTVDQLIEMQTFGQNRKDGYLLDSNLKAANHNKTSSFLK
jgi:hypothetical protein